MNRLAMPDDARANKFPIMPEQENKSAGASPRPRKGSKRPAPARTGELWAKCPECRMPVKDAELFKHLLNCPGAEARKAEWAAEQANAKPETPAPAPIPASETPAP
jgi:hypothetical protein